MQAKSALTAFAENPQKVKYIDQDDGEEIILLLRRHFVTNASWIILGSIMITAPLVFVSLLRTQLFEPFYREFSALPEDFVFILALLWYLLTLGFIFERFINWYFNVYILTNKRIIDIDFWGLLYRTVSETELGNIEDVTFRMNGLGATIFNYGDLFIQTAGTKPEFDFLAVPRPDIVHDRITDLAQAAKRYDNR